MRERIGEQAHEQGRERVAALPALTGLRFVAALLVIAYHLRTIVLPAAPSATGALISNMAAAGFVGVDLFFVLSGFILAYTYVTPGGALRTSVRRFWVARVARVYPVYLLGFLASAWPYLHPLAGPPPRHLLASAVATLTLVHGWVPGWAAWVWDGPSWSLSVEAFCYLLFPWLATPVARLTDRRPKRALVTLWALALLVPAAYLLANPDHYGPAHTWGWLDGAWWQVVMFNPLVKLPTFLFGVVLGALFVRDRGCAPVGRRRRAPRAVLAGGALALVLAASPLVPYPLWRNGLLDPLFGLLIYGLAGERGALVRLLSMSLLVGLGEASDSLYLLHIPVRDALGHILGGLPSGGGPVALAFCALYVLLAVSVSVVVHRTVEEPARRAIQVRWG